MFITPWLLKEIDNKIYSTSRNASNNVCLQLFWVVFLCYYICNLPRKGAEATDHLIGHQPVRSVVVTTSSLPDSSVFHLPCLKGTVWFFSIKLKATGGKHLCFVGLRASYRPVRFLTGELFYFVFCWSGCGDSYLCLSLNVSFGVVFVLVACEGQWDWGASVVMLAAH